MPDNNHVCPWWMGYFLVNPMRRLRQNPDDIISPYVKEGMRVVEVGPGMGYFTIPMVGLAMKRLGMKHSEIEQVVYENPRRFFNLPLD